ncbi:DUF3152 domain-containing protein [Allokutzneria sp. A3M-2-11 16]|uniref:DUF3152 domain-containing protein n=1 Tax=Allokutzneria sp. A3M-2-11 16 TaxID=2962043 RepID=UPI0020B69056|nr:DUF3152 domain-containing protein [Allokutzneria sp. A3M-2-11 16]MCP3798551.1 DUF3152 domain-containing protein [Allokutzneria sp. A3M-2-11 16]
MTRTEHGRRGTHDNGGSARPVRPQKVQQSQRVRRERRTQFEPLVASWDPHGEKPKEQRERPKAKKKPGVGGAIATYGWRVYALPVLVVLTVLAFVDFGTAPTDSQAGGGPQSSSSEEPPEQLEPVVAEAPPGKIDVNIPTAELPKTGEKYAESGPNTFSVVRGSTGVVGTTGKLYRYTIEIENGIDTSVVQGEDAFARVVDGILGSPKSWVGSKNGSGVRLQRVDSTTPAPDFRISLTTPNTARRPDVCNYTIQYEASCWNSTQDRVYINLARWVRGAIAYGPDLGLYRTYAINHEVGHVFRNQHRGCAEENGVAPVMMQQSFGVANDYVALLNQNDPGNKNAVKADGKTCKPNPWPNP